CRTPYARPAPARRRGGPTGISRISAVRTYGFLGRLVRAGFFADTHDVAKRVAIAFQIFPGLRFGGTGEQRMSQPRMCPAEVYAAEDAPFGECFEYRSCRPVQAQGALVEDFALEQAIDSLDTAEHLLKLCRARAGSPGDPRQPFGSQ